GVGVMLDKPVIAAVHGYCVGGAFCLVEFADLAIADETADFFYPEAQIGFCGGLIAGLAARINHKHAMDILVTRYPYKAHRAYALCIVNKV
ncbi:MAG: enoyl-CoA hydratase/isomerase family protein, partial [Rhodospirillales bacterium]